MRNFMMLAMSLWLLLGCTSEETMNTLNGTLTVVEVSESYGELNAEYELMIARFNEHKKVLAPAVRDLSGIALRDIGLFKAAVEGLRDWKSDQKTAVVSMMGIKDAYVKAKASYLSANTALIESDEVNEVVKRDMRDLHDDLTRFDQRVTRLWGAMEDKADISPEFITMLKLTKRIIQSVAVRE